MSLAGWSKNFEEKERWLLAIIISSAVVTGVPLKFIGEYHSFQAKFRPYNMLHSIWFYDFCRGCPVWQNTAAWR